jgi:hypothetical protein
MPKAIGYSDGKCAWQPTKEGIEVNKTLFEDGSIEDAEGNVTFLKKEGVLEGIKASLEGLKNG